MNPWSTFLFSIFIFSAVLLVTVNSTISCLTTWIIDIRREIGKIYSLKIISMKWSKWAQKLRIQIILHKVKWKRIYSWVSLISGAYGYFYTEDPSIRFDKINVLRNLFLRYFSHLDIAQCFDITAQIMRRGSKFRHLAVFACISDEQNRFLTGFLESWLAETRIKKRFWARSIQAKMDKTITFP